MRLRHKQPTLVSMWMLDVFCCALGCVILLLLLKMREASITAEEADSASANLIDTQLKLSESEAKLLALGAEIKDRDGKLALLMKEREHLARNLAIVEKQGDDAARQLALVRTERDSLATKLAVVENAIKTSEKNLLLARKKIDENAKLLALANQRTTDSEEELAKKKADAAELARKITDAQKDRKDLLQLIRDKEKARADLSDRLTASETKLKNSQKMLDEMGTKAADVAKLRTRVTEMEKQIADANVTIVDLQGTKAKLADKIDQLRIDEDRKFAGVSMTGRNVLFLVDISGSMDRTDENTVDPTKWPTVRDTLIKVMRTLPNLEQFQVILFSSRFNYLLGNDGQWLAIDKTRLGEKEKVLQQVHRALTATKPVGDTNLYAAFEEAFRFRSKGLDTIYLFSDGLPTSGPGLTAQEDRTLTGETERGTVLGRYLRGRIRTIWNAPNSKREKVRINSIGFFYESPDVGAFLWALSRENDGSFVGMSKP